MTTSDSQSNLKQLTPKLLEDLTDKQASCVVGGAAIASPGIPDTWPGQMQDEPSASVANCLVWDIGGDAVFIHHAAINATKSPKVTGCIPNL